MRPTTDTLFAHYMSVTYSEWARKAMKTGHWRDANRFVDISLDYWRQVQWRT